MNTILITGSGKRLGKELAIKFAEKGWNIILHSFTSTEKVEETAKIIQDLNVNVFKINFDIRNYNSIQKAFLDIKNNFYFPDVLINNAAIFPAKKKITELDEDFWDNTLDINLKGTFLVSKEFSKFANENSRIINIASTGAFEIWKHRIPYNVSKNGVIQLTKALARELAPKISVNSVSPGGIEIKEDLPSEPLTINVSKIPFQRFATVEDIFDAVYFFATCTNYITAQNLTIDGGYSTVR